MLLVPSILDDPRIRVDRRYETLCLTARNRSERQQCSARAVERCSRTTATAGHTCFLIVPVTPPEVPLNRTHTHTRTHTHRACLLRVSSASRHYTIHFLALLDTWSLIYSFFLSFFLSLSLSLSLSFSLSVSLRRWLVFQKKKKKKKNERSEICHGRGTSPIHDTKNQRLLLSAFPRRIHDHRCRFTRTDLFSSSFFFNTTKYHNDLQLSRIILSLLLQLRSGCSPLAVGE